MFTLVTISGTTGPTFMIEVLIKSIKVLKRRLDGITADTSHSINYLTGSKQTKTVTHFI